MAEQKLTSFSLCFSLLFLLTTPVYLTSYLICTPFYKEWNIFESFQNRAVFLEIIFIQEPYQVKNFCSFCSLGCYVGGKKYEFGEEYKTSSDPCTTCICSSSPKNQTCTSTVCSPSCTDPVWNGGVCCNYECPDDKKFKKVCTRGNGPLCASNNKTYSNLCVFETAHSKDKELKKLYDGNCSAKGKFTSS